MQIKIINYLWGEELLVHSNNWCCCTASATATLCFAFTHTLARSPAPSLTHLLTHALSVGFNPLLPSSLHCFFLCWSLLLSHFLLGLPLLVQAFPLYLCTSQHPYNWFLSAKKLQQTNRLMRLELFHTPFLSCSSSAQLCSLTCLLTKPHALAPGVCFLGFCFFAFKKITPCTLAVLTSTTQNKCNKCVT